MNDSARVEFIGATVIPSASARHRVSRMRSWLAVCIASICTAAAVPAPAEIVIASDPAATAPPSVVPEPEGEIAPRELDRMEFLNGDRLQGAFVSMDAQSGVKWRHPSIGQSFEVDPAGLARITLARGAQTNGTPAETCLVALTNEDELMGTLVSLDDQALVLQTWYAGAVTIPRGLVREISPGQTARLAVYEGPESLESWTVGSNASGGRRGGAGEWRHKNGYFYGMGNASIGKDVGMPDRCRLEFEIAWNGYLQMAFSFYCENLEKYGGNAYVLQMSSGSVYLQRNNKDGNSVNLGHAESQLLAQRSKALVTLLCHREQKSITLLVNGTMVKQWTERGDFSPGKGIAFFQQGQGAVRIGSIRVTEWDGKYDAADGVDAPAEKDTVQLSNQDKISGRLLSIRDGTMEFGTEFATMQVPLERVAAIATAGEGRTEAARRPTDVRAVFGRKGSITLTVSQWDDRQVVGESAGLGIVKVVPWAFSRIEFNLEREEEDEELSDLEAARAEIQEFFNR